MNNHDVEVLLAWIRENIDYHDSMMEGLETSISDHEMDAEYRTHGLDTARLKQIKTLILEEMTMTRDEYKAKQSELAEAYGRRQAMTAKAWLTDNVSQEKCEYWMLAEWQDFMQLAHDLSVKYEAQADG